MKILYFYPKTDDMIMRHVDMLAEGLRHSAEVQTATDYPTFRQLLDAMKPDILHCHGCWHYPTHKAAAKVRKAGIRVVLSPHGQLAPWIVTDHGGTIELQLQRRATTRAYSLIAFGKMEEHYLRQTGWNPRIEVIRNAVITNSLTPQQMCSQTFAVYQKVLDSSVLEQMTTADRQLLAAIIKAGITGDPRWIPEEIIDSTSINSTSVYSSSAWRRLLIYAEHVNIRNYVDYGISILRLHPDSIDTSKISAYLPKKYSRPVTIKQFIGEFKGNETDYLIRMIRQLQKAPQLLHLIELHRELLRDSVDDDSLNEALEEKHLTACAARLMQILSEQTLLDEGYMPLDPLDDRGTLQLRRTIANHLKIL